MSWVVTSRLGLLFICSFAVQSAVVALSAPGYASETAPQFQDFASETVIISKPVAPDLSNGRAHQYKTRLRQAIKLPANFAGHMSPSLNAGEVTRSLGFGIQARPVQWGGGSNGSLHAIGSLRQDSDRRRRRPPISDFGFQIDRLAPVIND